MDLPQSVQYAAAIIIVVGAGIILGMAMRRRQPLQSAHSQHERLQTYAELITYMDGLRSADDAGKQHFIATYYRALVYAPDEVVKALNLYLQGITSADSSYDPAKLSARRDAAVLAMRRDAQGQLDSATKLKPADMYSIEVNVPEPSAPVIKPESQVDTSAQIAKPSNSTH